MTRVAVTDVSAAAQLACLLEVSAAKPGNVSPGRHFADARYEDFLASAAAIGRSFADVGTRSLGATVRSAVAATSCWTQSNTNLGIILLLAPIARAAVLGPQDLRQTLCDVLNSTSIEDARDVYAAIRHARPGGLGSVDAQDVAGEPTTTLLEVMKLAADRDGIAREYATAFELTFESGTPALARARREGLSWDEAIIETFLTILADRPDTHVARRAGDETAMWVSREAKSVLASGGIRSAAGREAIDAMDLKLRSAGHAANPGTTADLTAAATFVVLLGGGWRESTGGVDAATR